MKKILNTSFALIIALGVLLLAGPVLKADDSDDIDWSLFSQEIQNNYEKCVLNVSYSPQCKSMLPAILGTTDDEQALAELDRICRSLPSPEDQGVCLANLSFASQGSIPCDYYLCGDLVNYAKAEGRGVALPSDVGNLFNDLHELERDPDVTLEDMLTEPEPELPSAPKPKTKATAIQWEMFSELPGYDDAKSRLDSCLKSEFQFLDYINLSDSCYERFPISFTWSEHFLPNHSWEYVEPRVLDPAVQKEFLKVCDRISTEAPARSKPKCQASVALISDDISVCGGNTACAGAFAEEKGAYIHGEGRMEAVGEKVLAASESTLFDGRIALCGDYGNFNHCLYNILSPSYVPLGNDLTPSQEQLSEVESLCSFSFEQSQCVIQFLEFFDLRLCQIADDPALCYQFGLQDYKYYQLPARCKKVETADLYDLCQAQIIDPEPELMSDPTTFYVHLVLTVLYLFLLVLLFFLKCNPDSRCDKILYAIFVALLIVFFIRLSLIATTAAQDYNYTYWLDAEHSDGGHHGYSEMHSMRGDFLLRVPYISFRLIPSVTAKFVSSPLMNHFFADLLLISLIALLAAIFNPNRSSVRKMVISIYVIPFIIMLLGSILFGIMLAGF